MWLFWEIEKKHNNYKSTAISLSEEGGGSMREETNRGNEIHVTPRKWMNCNCSCVLPPECVPGISCGPDQAEGVTSCRGSPHLLWNLFWIWPIPYVPSTLKPLALRWYNLLGPQWYHVSIHPGSYTHLLIITEYYNSSVLSFFSHHTV